MVDGKIGDQPARFLVDTGANVHAIDARVAAAAKLTLEASGSTAHDPTGQAVAVQRAKHPRVSLEGWGEVAEHEAAVIELPQALRDKGIAGLLSPQLLVAKDRAVVVDMVNRQLRSRPLVTAWAEHRDAGPSVTPSPGPTRPCAVSSSGLSGLVLAVDGTVGGEAIRLELDTGASRTMVIEGSKAGARAASMPLTGNSTSTSAAGGLTTSIHGGVKLAAGAWSDTREVGVTAGTRHAECGYEGRLGVDVLQHCVIAISNDEVRVACRLPGE